MLLTPTRRPFAMRTILEVSTVANDEADDDGMLSGQPFMDMLRPREWKKFAKLYPEDIAAWRQICALSARS